jgi:hypothetical protein
MERLIQASEADNSLGNEGRTFEPSSGSDLRIISLDFSYGAACARAVLPMRFKVDPEFGALFAESLSEFLAHAFSFEGTVGARVNRVPGDDWLIWCYFNSSAVRSQFTASRAHRRHIRHLREFIV